MVKLLKILPLPIAGLMLGIATLGNLLGAYSATLKGLCGLLSAMIFVLLTAKVLLLKKEVKQSLENPVIASVFPTYSMGLMLLATYLKPFSNEIAMGLWFGAILVHLLLMVYFTKKFILDFKIQKVFPSYFVVYVGIVVASVTAPAFGQINLGQFFFWFGFGALILLLPIVLYRLVVVKGIPEPAKPTFVILAAPASLLLAGYISSFQEKSLILVMILLLVSLLLYMVAVIGVTQLIKLPFYPSYSAFTFPMAISVVGAKKAFVYLTKAGIPIEKLNILINAQLAIATVLIVYVLVKYLIFIWGKFSVDNSLKAVNDSV